MADDAQTGLNPSRVGVRDLPDEIWTYVCEFLHDDRHRLGEQISVSNGRDCRG